MIKERITKLLEKMKENELDAFVISSYENYRYFSGFTGSNCTLIISEKGLYALTDGRYDIQIRNQAKDFSPVVISRSMTSHVAEILKSLQFSRVGYETSNVTDSYIRTLKAESNNIEFVPSPDFGEEIRAVKDENEIAFIRRAVKCADDAFNAFIPQIKKGMTERNAAALLEYEMARRGSRKPAFETIAASEIRGSMPHAEPQDIEIPGSCLMTFDFGATVDGYMSDITRTIHIGNPSRELCELWDTVFEVQQKCIKYAKPGLTCRELDEYQRSLFSENSLDKYIMHSLGHGVGLAIHEAPTVSKRCDTPLSKNMIITIEPGLYVENLGGVRIEDTVLITEDGAVALTQSPHRINITL
ncbi:MAG: aminopeptidase P family protein [Ruminococcaceae bacterium]|nr:aminopeptidase P family protein [Oscillospiraceae bacterium]